MDINSKRLFIPARRRETWGLLGPRHPLGLKVNGNSSGERQPCLRSQPGPQWRACPSSAMSLAVTSTPPVSLKARMMSTETFSGKELRFLPQTTGDSGLHPGLQAQPHHPHHLPSPPQKDSPSWNTALCSCSVSYNSLHLSAVASVFIISKIRSYDEYR